jgi:hypothetical protein
VSAKPPAKKSQEPQLGGVHALRPYPPEVPARADLVPYELGELAPDHSVTPWIKSLKAHS